MPLTGSTLGSFLGGARSTLGPTLTSDLTSDLIPSPLAALLLTFLLPSVGFEPVLLAEDVEFELAGFGIEIDVEPVLLAG